MTKTVARGDLEFFVRRIRNLVGCILHCLFCITSELLSFALRLLSETFSFQICGACDFTGRFLDFSRGLIGYARNLVRGATHYPSPWGRTVTIDDP